MFEFQNEWSGRPVLTFDKPVLVNVPNVFDDCYSLPRVGILCFVDFVIIIFFDLQTQETNALITAVLEVQPRLASGGSGKTSDEIVYELAESILSKLPVALDMEKADKAIFEVGLTENSEFILKPRSS